MRIGLPLLAFAILLALTGCGTGNTVSVQAGIPADFTSILSGLTSAVNETQSDLVGENKDSQMGASNQAGTCVNLVANVDYDVTTIIDHDRQDVIDEVNNLQAAIAVVRQDIANWKNDVVAIANQGVPQPSDDASAISSANTKIQQALSTADGEINMANTYVHQAYSMADGLSSGTCSGHGPGAEPSKIGYPS
jgi:hypothetical protein